MTGKSSKLLWIVILLVLQAACSQAEPTTIDAPESYPIEPGTAANMSAYPSGEFTGVPETYPVTDLSIMEPNAYPYPQPTFDVSELIQFVTPDPEMGSVTVQIFYKGEPLQYATFFLANVLISEKTGLEAATRLDRSSAPRAVSDENGVVTFQNIQPQRYGLILISGIDTYLLLYPDRQEAILLTVDAGKQVDLGVFDYEDLPLD